MNPIILSTENTVIIYSEKFQAMLLDHDFESGMNLVYIFIRSTSSASLAFRRLTEEDMLFHPFYR